MKFNMNSAPRDPIRRLAFLADKQREFAALLDREYQLAYFEARQTGRLEFAERLGLHSKKRILKWTRVENEARGRMMRWGDHADPTSSSYRD